MAIRKEKAESAVFEDDFSETKAATTKTAVPKRRGKSAGTAGRKVESVEEPDTEEVYNMFEEVAQPVYYGGNDKVCAETGGQNFKPQKQEGGLVEKLFSNKLRILEVLFFLAALAVSAKYLLDTVWHSGDSRVHSTFIEPANPVQFSPDVAPAGGGVKQYAEVDGTKEQVRQDMVELGGMLLDLDKRVSDLESGIKKLEDDVSTFAGDKKAQVKPEIQKEKTTKDKKQSVQPRRSGKMADWRILGFSGTRVVIQTPNGSHFLRVGQVLDGVTIQSISATDGIIETSEGALRCTR